MNKTANILLEIGCAELPAKSQATLCEQLSTLFANKLNSAQFSFEKIESWVSPRRLAVLIENAVTMQADKTMVRKGPALTAAYDKEGKPTPALLGFMKANSLSLDNIREEQGYAVATIHEQGKSLASYLPILVKDVIKSFAIPKPMRWGNTDTAFLRPVSWIVLLLDKDIIEVELFDLNAGRESKGHRFHHPEAISINSPEDYETKLREAKVIVNQQIRKETIVKQIKALADSLHATAVMPDDLLDEVIGLVEWPVALLCPFDPAFLSVPKEALILAMQQHQKSFALIKDDKLLPYFITIANIDSKNKERVIEGNARVMHARLADAAFFYEHDKQTPLKTFAAELARVTFQDKLGSMQEKTKRVTSLALHIADVLQLNADAKEHLTRAASLYKADLMSRMVGEFPELQGTMGYYYAKAQQEADAVALALRDYYHPRFAEDSLPESQLGQILALAERIDTLVGNFVIGHRPTGDKDPYGLRRAALGLVRILLEKQLNLDLFALLQESIKILNEQKSWDIDTPIASGKMYTNTGQLTEDGSKTDKKKNIAMELIAFIYERFKAYGLSQKLLPDSYNAVAYSDNSGFIYDKHLRWQALETFREKPECARLAEANKRVNNILKNQSDLLTVDMSKLSQEEEKALYQILLSVQTALQQTKVNKGYQEVLLELMPLCEPIDNFFDKVMVNVDDVTIRHNRLALLQALKQILQHVADLSQLQIVNV